MCHILQQCTALCKHCYVMPPLQNPLLRTRTSIIQTKTGLCLSLQHSMILLFFFHKGMRRKISISLTISGGWGDFMRWGRREGQIRTNTPPPSSLSKLVASLSQTICKINSERTVYTVCMTGETNTNHPCNADAWVQNICIL